MQPRHFLANIWSRFLAEELPEAFTIKVLFTITFSRKFMSHVPFFSSRLRITTACVIAWSAQPARPTDSFEAHIYLKGKLFCVKISNSHLCCFVVST